MNTEKIKGFTLEYSLYCDAEPGFDIHFGMDFTLKNKHGLALCQLIFPATAVGTNIPGRWNIDNHATGHAPEDLIFKNAEGGIVVDGPREISHRDEGWLSTKFAVYPVNLEKQYFYSEGVSFGYSANTSSRDPEVKLISLGSCKLPNDQKAVVVKRCPGITFLKSEN